MSSQAFLFGTVLSVILILVRTQTCIVPSLCNNGPFNLLTNPAGGLGCAVECAAVCGVGSTGVCASFNGVIPYSGPDLTSNPTSAQCQCTPPQGSTCMTNNVTTFLISEVWIAIYGDVCPLICVSCGATSGVGSYNPDNYLFACTCLY